MRSFHIPRLRSYQCLWFQASDRILPCVYMRSRSLRTWEPPPYSNSQICLFCLAYILKFADSVHNLVL